ncbi:chromosomal replication initiator DnaA [Hyphobacterium sp. CCMP332]|jgi:chromosomal replication initiation ATPase DnaA|uniref:helix-turn-helix domain-containing protein n=1 Tax=Hyphobacterium sp. CCMP332 TaxID=2749086 RepID=UPI00164F9729|nr:helix-turn-helix domain-containing protein [Hyphobacterium sp. CCMP332]QNL19157.1 chromosomal replication initiator DnaA [Hyphobacterium sp. CCMP332]
MCGQQFTERDLARARLARETVAFAFNVPAEEIAAPTRRSSDVAFARQVAMYLSHVAFELNLARVGQAFGRDRSTASYACQIVEDRRDDPDFDAWLDGLEECLRTAPEPKAVGAALR